MEKDGERKRENEKEKPRKYYKICDTSIQHRHVAKHPLIRWQYTQASERARDMSTKIVVLRSVWPLLLLLSTKTTTTGADDGDGGVCVCVCVRCGPSVCMCFSSKQQELIQVHCQGRYQSAHADPALQNT